MYHQSNVSRLSLRNLLMISLIAMFFSCSKSNPANNSSAAITSFNFLKATNPIAVDATASISGTNINIFLPPGTNTNALVASFNLSDSAIVRVNGVAQQSGVTAVDFSTPVNYTVSAQNGSTQSYTVTVTTDISTIDQNVTAFMSKYNVPGLSIAITLDEKLVYVKAYGQSDVEDNQNANNQNLYRIASLSKQITSVAIMKLMDQGKINMDDKVFGPGSILGTEYGTFPYGPGVTDITVSELLHHTEGGWPVNGNDPMLTNPTMTAPQLISWTLNNDTLTSPPGTAYIYSHFGYCVLGRVIEKITGLSYTEAIQSLVLQPSGISDMVIAGNTLAQRAPNEVKYYDAQDEQLPYDFNITRMDATEGWLASATDLARFLVHVDGLSPLTIISSNAVNVMTSGSAANPKYGCGWELNDINWFHHGNLPGTGTEQARTVQSGNFNFVILTNTSNQDPNFNGDMDNIFWTSISNTPAWPTYDLF
jgi:D-alanyl-D-alanine carboxypeptidase